MNTTEKEIIRNLISSFYDIQKVRVAVGNRVVANFRNAQNISVPAEEKPAVAGESVEEKEDTTLLPLLKKEYYKISEELALYKGTLKSYFKNPDSSLQFILSVSQYRMVDHYISLLKSEEEVEKTVTMYVKEHPLWEAFLKDVKGCGPLMAGVIISYFDIEKARHVSSFWKYAGLDTVPVVNPEDPEDVTWVGRSRKYTEDREYIDKKGEVQMKKGLTFNPFLKTKLLGVLGSSFLRSKSSYSDIYYDYKNRLNESPKHADKTPMHKHNMANRYMLKQFVRDLWVAWRELENLPVTEPYEVAKLGMAPHKYNNNQHLHANM